MEYKGSSSCHRKLAGLLAIISLSVFPRRTLRGKLLPEEFCFVTEKI
jgi:hypothetical protein